MGNIIVNTVLLVLSYVVPLYIVYLYKDNGISLEKFHVLLLSIIIFLGAILLIYTNHKYRKQAKIYKWLYLIFEIIGLVGFLFSGSILIFLYLLRNFSCCGF